MCAKCACVGAITGPKPTILRPSAGVRGFVFFELNFWAPCLMVSGVDLQTEVGQTSSFCRVLVLDTFGTSFLLMSGSVLGPFWVVSGSSSLDFELNTFILYCDLQYIVSIGLPRFI